MWLTFFPFVHFNSNKKCLLLYNTLNYESFYLKANSHNFRFINKIKNNQNTFAVKLNGKEICNTYINKILRKLQKKFIANLTPTYEYNKAPFQIPAKIFLLSDVEKLKISKKEIDFISYEILNDIPSYISELFIYINNCIDKKDYCQHNLFPSFLYSNEYLELSSSLLRFILDQLRDTHLKEVNLLGGNIFKHSQIIDIIKLSKEYHYNFILHLYYKELDFNIIDNKFEYIIHISFPVDGKIFYDIITNLNFKKIEFKLNFIITNEDDFYIANNLIMTYNINNYMFNPIIKENIAFIKENLFLSRKEILSRKLTMQTIQRNQKLNTNFFGKIIIINDGNIYSNLNNKSIGNINDISIVKSIASEFVKVNSWRQTRLTVKPCKYCVFNSLCPPISNYEYALKQYNLCNIKI